MATSGDKNFLCNVKAFILPTGIGNVRVKLFQKQIREKGGTIHEKYQDSATSHIIVDEKMEADRVLRLMKVDEIPEKVVVVKTLWLSACLKAKNVVELGSHQLPIKSVKKKEAAKSHPDQMDTCADATVMQKSVKRRNWIACEKAETSGGTKPPDIDGPSSSKLAKITNEIDLKHIGLADSDSDYIDSDQGENSTLDTGPGKSYKRPLPKGSWICSKSSVEGRVNHNKLITDKLEALAKTYTNTNDKWRALGYQKAITALKRYHKPITSFEEAKALTGVGDRLAEKIWEIIESGELRKLDELSSCEEIKALELFTNVWGAGPTTARGWVQQGFRTLEDLRTKANLTRHQVIGLKHFDDLIDRMPRSEAAEIEAVVIKAANSIDPSLVCMACGSYRRGKTTCGDVDVLITHPDGKSHKGIFTKILAHLHATGFLTDDLVSQEDSGNQKKYLGVCKLPGENKRHRRLDIIVVPYHEFACAIMYFTGSAHFNRSMRHLAGKMGMSLSEHSLNTGVVRRRGEKINPGTPLPTPTEESVFEHLGLKYRPPEERDH